MTTVKTVPLGSTGKQVPNVVLGLMRIENMNDDEVRELLTAGRDAGIDMVDHADIYGSELHACERRFAEAMRLTPSEREAVTIQTKAGIVKAGPYFDYSYEHIVSSVEGSLRALETDYIDVLLLHRPDALVEPDEVARAFDESSRRPARSARSASRTTRPGRSSCCAGRSVSRSWRTRCSSRSRTRRSSRRASRPT